MSPFFSIPRSVPASIFRAYDIRGLVDETLTEELVYAIALAIGSEALACDESSFIVARDGRLSGPRFFAALCEGLLATGCELIDIGMVPTPVFYFAMQHLGLHSGVILTGSHNPKNYNGLKIILQGKSLTPEKVQALRDRILARHFSNNPAANKKRVHRQAAILEDYILRILNDIKLARPIKLVIDCGNGVGGCVASDLFKRLGCDVTALYCEVDGHFPHHHPDPSQAVNLVDLIEAVRSQGADLGLAFDGDADRLGVVTNTGEIIWPDRLLMLYAKDILLRNPGACILFDIKCSRHLPEVISSFGGQPLMWKTGHSLIKNKMGEVGALLAGEMSGHIFFKERWYGFDDGLYAAARLLEILSKEQKSISTLFKELPNSLNTPELILPFSDDDKFNFMQKVIEQAGFIEAKLTEIDGLRLDFKEGWGLVRASNTTACLTLRFEAENAIALEKIQATFRSLLLSVNASLLLPF